MKIVVVICSVGRPQVLHDTMLQLQQQTLPATAVLIGTPSPEHVLPATLEQPDVHLVLTPLGLCRQRNSCLPVIRKDAELIAFLDDDMELAPTYFEAMAALFAAQPDLVASSGTLLHDGGVSVFHGREHARALCQEAAGRWKKGQPTPATPRRFAYGCNMVFRSAAIGEARFDEALPLYAWLEDSDFSHTITKGRMAPQTNGAAFAVHLGARGGRISGRRLGFSQMVNPFYLWRKSRVFSLPYLSVHYWARCIVGNLLGLMTGEPAEDRPGRLIGNLLGIGHLLSGKARPQDALKLPGRAASGPVSPATAEQQAPSLAMEELRESSTMRGNS